MALASTLYRFHIKLSDVDRGIYQPLELRVAMHPSEALTFLLTRVIAYCLNLQEGIELTQGIGSSDEPAIHVKDLTGAMKVWIDIGTPSARRLHKASKVAKKVLVYTYRDPAILMKEVSGEEIYRKDEIEVYSLTPKFLNELATTLDRDNSWELLFTEGEISINVRGKSVQGELTFHRLVKA